MVVSLKCKQVKDTVVVMPFPLAKLIALGLRQASRHVANFVKIKAKENEKFRKILVKSAGCKCQVSKYFPGLISPRLQEVHRHI